MSEESSPQLIDIALLFRSELHSVFFYKNIEAEINQNFKNVLRTFLRLRVD